jgi:methylmalonyl-CoA mutase, C-terminal domain
MRQKGKAIKIVLAQFPLETHSRGIITVANILRDGGLEVILIGNSLPENIIKVAVQTEADIIGISSYCGGELLPASDLIKAAEYHGIKNRVIFLLGGIFPPENAQKLKELGFSGTFPPSTTGEEILNCIEEAIENQRLAVS